MTMWKCGYISSHSHLVWHHLPNMKLIITAIALVFAARADSQSYGAPPAPLGGYGCPEGQVVGPDGKCATPIITRNVFVYTAPEQPPADFPAPYIPPPEVQHNILFIRTPEKGAGPEPIVIPPPRQQSIVYVLNKQQSEGPKVIEVPSDGPQTPEVYFVNYEEGDNPILPSGFDLQTGLQAAANGGGQVLGGGGGGGGAGIGGGAGGGGGGYSAPAAPADSYSVI
ncbi:translation initiation factor IF-2-like [Penaeus japonicus]|uniref:translation initiation factor IF-2-like n=1 Tax=Penaeus japonicus TaxID=27405 RepID=UPI001C70E848|nr:translation initiation factor IF-2-like [Penaeus japonicus]